MQRRFQLADTPSAGVYCDEGGLFVGGTPLLEHVSKGASWQPRPLDQLSLALGRVYGLEVDGAAIANGIAALAGALDRHDVAHAQLVTLFLRMPDPPALSKASGPEF